MEREQNFFVLPDIFDWHIFWGEYQHNFQIVVQQFLGKWKILPWNCKTMNTEEDWKRESSEDNRGIIYGQN